MVTKYTHLLERVNYPSENGYRMEVFKLPDWIHLTVTEGESKFLTVHSRIHVNKAVIVGPSYSTEFRDRDLIAELSGEISHRFL